MTEVELDHAVYAGVKLTAHGDDLVALEEEHEARLERGISILDWMAMDVYEKALLIAVRRNQRSISNIQAEAEIAKSQSDAKRKGKR